MATLKKKKGDSLLRSLSKILTSEVFFQLNKMNEHSFDYPRFVLFLGNVLIIETTDSEKISLSSQFVCN